MTRRRLVPPYAERAALLAALAPRDVRRACGIRAVTIAAALGVPGQVISYWDTGARALSGPKGYAYVRVVRALARHLDIPEESG